MGCSLMFAALTLHILIAEVDIHVEIPHCVLTRRPVLRHFFRIVLH